MPPLAAVPELPDDTVRAVVVEVVEEQLARYRATCEDERPVAYVAQPTGDGCPATVVCRPLHEQPDLRELPVGHLHRTLPAPDAPLAGTEAAAAELAELAERIEVGVAHDLLDVRLAYARHEIAHLEIALTTNRTIGVAVGVLMATLRCTSAQAFDLLRTASQNQNRKLHDIALDVQDTGVILDRRQASG